MHPTEEFWNKMFEDDTFLYGEEPNEFLKENIHFFKNESKILSLGDGEGRNSIFLAKNGHIVTASDASSKGLEKLNKLTEKNNVSVETRHEDVVTGDWDNQKWNGIINIYCHLAKNDRIKVYEKIKESLTSGGFFLTEVFSTEQLNYRSGGPANIDLLLTLEEFNEHFEGYKILYSQKEIISLDEGDKHKGEGSVIRFIAEKP